MALVAWWDWAFAPRCPALEGAWALGEGLWAVQGDYIWIEPVVKSEFASPIGARVLDAEAGRIRVLDDEGQVSSGTARSVGQARKGAGYRRCGWGRSGGSS